MAFLIVIQLGLDAEVLRTQTLAQRINGQTLTSIELIFVWGLVGLGLYQLARSQRQNRSVAEVDAHGD
jgi:hypothetical protein